MVSSPLTLHSIASLFTTVGHDQYGGEVISQLEHALQCGLRAEEAGEPDAVIVAAFLHDIGHLLQKSDALHDDRHQELGAAALATLFGHDVCESVRLHVAAKRYLCHADPDYAARLSEESTRTLKLQGGVFTAAEAERFKCTPYADAAIRVRKYDEDAKRAGAATPPLRHFLKIAERYLQRRVQIGAVK